MKKYPVPNATCAPVEKYCLRHPSPGFLSNLTVCLTLKQRKHIALRAQPKPQTRPGSKGEV